jgi:hypothetical protein
MLTTGGRETVSSIGIVRGKKMFPGTVDGMKHVCYFRHALALDEQRVKFLPEYAYGGTSLSRMKDDGKSIDHGSPDREEDDDEGKLPSTKDNDRPDQLQVRKESTGEQPQTMEVWFAGTHSDM